MATRSKTEIIIAAVDQASRIIDGIGARMASLTKPFNNVISASKNLSKVTAGYAVAVAGAAVGAAVLGLKAAGAADSIGDLAAQYGAATDEIQIYGAALAEGGGTIEDAAKGLGRLNRTINEAIHKGGEAREMFRGVGLSVADLQKMSNPQIIERMAEAFAHSNNERKKADVLNGLLGKSGSIWNDTLNKGGANLKELGEQMRADGRLLTPAQTAIADSFDKSYLRLTGTIAGVRNMLVLQLLPAIKPILDRLQKWIVLNRDLVETKFQTFVDGLPAKIEKAWEMLTKLWEILESLADTFERVSEAIGPFWTVVGVLTILFAPLILAVGQLIFSVGSLFVALGKATGLFKLAGVLIGDLWKIISFNPLLTLGFAIVGLAVLVYQNWDSIVAYTSKMWGRIKAVFEISFFDGLVQGIMEIFQGLLNGLVGIFKKMVPENLLPQSMRNYEFSFATNRANQITAAQAAAQKTQVGGVLKIQIDSQAPAKVTEIRKDNPGFDFDVNSGPIMAGS